VAETSRPVPFARDIVVIGGCGHVGLPLAIAFASRGLRVGIFDISESAVACVNSAKMPFAEPGAAPAMERAIAAGNLVASTDPAIVGTGEHVIVVIGTPVGENLEPDQSAIPNAMQGCAAHFAAGQAAGAEGQAPQPVDGDRVATGVRRVAQERSGRSANGADRGSCRPTGH